MAEFNPTNKKELTYGECLDPAMNITEPEDAVQYLNSYVRFIAEGLKEDEAHLTPKEITERAMYIAKHNLGYYAGYYDNETRARVERLFECEHPMFGSIGKSGVPSAKQAFEMGKFIGTVLKDKQDNK